MGGKGCFFIGHREASEEIYPALYAAVEQHILEYGVTEFIVGHYGGFDRLAASAVKEAKRFYPEVKLTLLLPSPPRLKILGASPFFAKRTSSGFVCFHSSEPFVP